MSQTELYQIVEWKENLSKHMGHLSKPQLEVLSLWSFAAALSKSCSLTVASVLLSSLLKRKENTMRQRLREFYKEADSKKGKKRQDLEVEQSFSPLLKWIMLNWPTKQLTIAMDATFLAERFAVLSINVVYRSCAIPVAWKILEEKVTHAWNPEWFKLLDLLAPAVNSDIQVLVFTDRGLYSPDLFRYIQKIGWHPFMRINRLGSFRASGKTSFYPIRELMPCKGTFWSSSGTAFKGNPIECTLFTFYGKQAQEPWVIITDIPPDQSDPCWYSLRSWIEQSFRTIKSGGLQWQATKMTHPDRASRLWLVIAVSMLWLLLSGTEQDLLDTPERARLYTQSKRRTSVFRKGWFALLTALLFNSLPHLGSFVPEILPTHNLKPFYVKLE